LKDREEKARLIVKINIGKRNFQIPTGGCPYLDQGNPVHTISAFILELMSIDFILSYLKNKKLFLSNKRMGNLVK
jgi:hypothetical protein